MLTEDDPGPATAVEWVAWAVVVLAAFVFAWCADRLRRAR